MPEQRPERRLAAILCADVVGYTKLAGTDEEGTIARLQALRRELVDPLIATHRGRVVKRTGDGALVEFASAVDAIRYAIEVQRGMIPRNAPLPPEHRIEFRIGINVGDVVVEGDDLLGDAVNIAARLEGVADPGGICLSEDAWRQVKDRLPADYIDCGEKNLKNVARPVRVFAVNTAHRPDATAPTLSGPPRLSIVVLPFVNIGGYPEQEYFVDGVTESLTTDLSRIAGAFVIARNTAFTYKGKPFDVKQIGRELNVRYVLEGSVQRAGNRLRVNVQLIDAETGTHLWAERFDKPVADLFDLQDEIVARLALQSGSELVAIEARRAEHSLHPDSMDLCFQGTACWHRGFSAENLVQARDFFARALTLDADNVEALVGMAFIDVRLAVGGLTDDTAARLTAAEAAVKRALTIVPGHAFAHAVLGHILTHSDVGQAIGECERALLLDRNLTYAHAVIGHAKTNGGIAEETEAHIRDALRLSPRDVMAYWWLWAAGYAKLVLGAHDEALGWLRRSIEANRSFPAAHFHLAATLAQMGRIKEAHDAAKAGLALNPGFTTTRFREGGSAASALYVAQRERVLAAMVMAGVPEG